MKIGIIVYSKTGHTYEAAEKLAAKLKVAGHEAVLEQILAEGVEGKSSDMKLQYKPETAGYDFLVFGAPVWAFSLCPVMKRYLAECSSLQGIKALAFVTMGFPMPFLGGNRAVRQMSALIESRGARVIDHSVICWGGERRSLRMEAMMSSFSRTIQA